MEASDPDGGTITLSVAGDPEVPWNAVFADSGNGIGSFFFDPDSSQADSVYLLDFIASDGVLADTAQLEVTVIEFVYGDPDANGAVNISDVTYLLAFIFGGGPEPQPYLSGDSDCNGSVNISDASYLIAFIFGGGPPPGCD
jgi:hypothetical protein